MRRQSSLWVLLVLFIVGGLIGNLLGQLLSAYVPILGQAVSIGITPPANANFGIFTFTLGFTLALNVLGMVGLLIGFMLWRR